jgi:hypothetical protein
LRLLLPLCLTALSIASVLVPLRLVAVHVPGRAPPSNPSLKMEALAAAPVPLSPTVWGLPSALSTSERLAALAPVAVGVKLTLMLQFAPAASVDGVSGQVVVRAKSPALVPVSPMLLIVSGALPLLVTVTGCDPLLVLIVWLAKVRLAGLILTAGAMPVPLSAIACGLPPASSEIERLAVRFPVPPGVKLTLMLQFAPAASVLGLNGQLLVCAKSPELLPPWPIALMVSGAVPLLVRVTDCVPLVVLTNWLLKAMLLRLRLTAGAAVAPVPLSAMLWGLPLASSVIERAAVLDPVASGVKLTLMPQFAPAASVEGAIGQLFT